MKLFKFFHSPKFNEQDRLRAETCLKEIVFAVSEKRGIPKFIHCDDGSVAFAGSREKMELVLDIFIQKYDGKNWLYASLDDEVSWQGWDYDSQTEFQNDIIDYLCNRVNRTVKFTTEKIKHKSYREATYYLDESTGEWVLCEDDCTEDKQFCRVIANCTKTTESIKTYKLDLR